ncbi:MAG TPA: hypothetical protein VKP30_21350 [Polyangiaceae bacterium]|nr:hypothetical protein [Polyangiaceae bacterium]
MVKFLPLLAFASSVTLAGCGLTTMEELDYSLMGDGKSNKTALGGFWWTYVDRTLLSEVTPNTGKRDPTNAEATELNPGLAPGVGQGQEIDGSHPAYHVTGKVIPVPSPLEPDPYWSDLFAEICKDGNCGEDKYPSAGIGFGFRPSNAPLGARAIGKDGKLTKGIGFRLKYGANHAKVGDTFQPVSVSAPMDLTDAPDPSFGDQFGSRYAGLNSTLYPNSDGTRNFPICSFPNSYKPDGENTYSSNTKTCFCNLTKTLDATDQWQTICVAWPEFESPGWGGLDSALVPEDGITQIIPERLIKIQFDAYKPSISEGEAAFDFWLDDVRLLSESDWDAYCSSQRL